MRRIELGVVIAGVVIAVISGLILDWFQNHLSRAASTPNDAGWQNRFSGACGYNLNQRPEPPASAYQSGAPAVTYRGTRRIGSIIVEAQ